MKRNRGALFVALMVIAAGGWTQFTDGVRTVQVLGLFASGVLFGVSMIGLILAVKTRRGP